MNVATYNKTTPYLFLVPALIIMVLGLLYPLGYMVYGSFRDWSPSQSLGESEFIGLGNYITLWNDPSFRESVGVTPEICGLCGQCRDADGGRVSAVA